MWKAKYNIMNENVRDLRIKKGKNYLPWIGIEHKKNIKELPKGKKAGKNYLPWFNLYFIGKS